MESFVQFRFACRRWARGLSLVLLGLGLTYCASMRGTVSGGRYTSPDGRVSVAIPSFSGTGRFQEHHDSSYFGVIMTDDVGALYRAEGFHPPLPATFDGKSTRACTEAALHNALTVIRSVCPAARIASSRFDPGLLGGAMIATVRMPAGSVAMVQKNAGPGRRVDSQRVLVIFKCNGALVTIAHHGGDLPTLMDEVLGIGNRQKEIDAGDERRAIRFAQSMRYQPKNSNSTES